MTLDERLCFFLGSPLYEADLLLEGGGPWKFLTIVVGLC